MSNIVLHHKAASRTLAGLAVAAFVFLAGPARAVLLQEMYVNASSPLFAEIPVCLNNIGEKASDFAVEIVGNEEINEEGSQPFIEGLEYRLDQINDVDAVLTLTSEALLPSNLQLIVTLLDQEGNQVDSQIYTHFGIQRQSPDNFGCDQFAEAVSAPKPAADLESFTIDIVNNDTWRNVAAFVNAAWYNNRFSVEQVMSSLYQLNLNQTPVVKIPGNLHSLPERMEIPSAEATEQIDRQAAMSLARLLDGSGSFKVERRKVPKRDLNKEQLDKLRQEVLQLREQLTLLTNQLADSKELLNIRNDELQKLQQDLISTRSQIAELEKVNLELQNRGIGYYLKESLNTPWPWILLVLIVTLFVLQGISARQRREDLSRLARQINNQRGYGYGDEFKKKK